MRIDYHVADDFYYVSGRFDNSYIIKNEEVVVESTVIDFDAIPDYIVGLRMPTQYLECDGGAGYKIRILNKRKYFILHTEDGSVYEYESKDIFEEKLVYLDIERLISLDNSKFDSTWKTYSGYYKNIDFTECEPQRDGVTH